MDKKKLDGLVANLKEALKNEDSTDNATSLLSSRLGNLKKLEIFYLSAITRSTDGMQSFLNLLDLDYFRNVTYVGGRIGSYDNKEFAQQLRDDKFRKMQMKIVNLLHQNSVGRILTRQSRYGDDSTMTLPLSIWTNVVHRASTKRPTYLKCGVSFEYVTHKSWYELSKDEKSEEEKEWKATAIFYLLKEGLVPNDEWRELISRSTKNETKNQVGDSKK